MNKEMMMEIMSKEIERLNECEMNLKNAIIHIFEYATLESADFLSVYMMVSLISERVNKRKIDISLDKLRELHKLKDDYISFMEKGLLLTSLFKKLFEISYIDYMDNQYRA